MDVDPLAPDADPAPKRPPWRPSKYNEATMEEICKVAYETLAAGGSQAQVAANLDISIQTLDTWKKEKPDFVEAISRGLAVAQAIWEDPDFRPDLHPRRWELNMKNRFGWKDRTEAALVGDGFTLIQNLSGKPKEEAAE